VASLDLTTCKVKGILNTFQEFVKAYNLSSRTGPYQIAKLFLPRTDPVTGIEGAELVVETTVETETLRFPLILDTLHKRHAMNFHSQRQRKGAIGSTDCLLPTIPGVRS